MQISTLADIEAIEKKPLQEWIKAPSSYDVIRETAQWNGDAPALVFFPNPDQLDRSVRLTYRELLSGIHQAANLFFELGVQPQDTISIILPNLPQTHLVLWGGQAAGIVNPINPLLSLDSTAAIMNQARARVLITLGQGPLFEKALGLRRSVPSLKHILLVGGEERSGFLSLETALKGQDPACLRSGRVIRPEERASYFHTGGTTGSPKIAIHTHANSVYMAWAIATVGMQSDDVVLGGLPLFHVNGVFVTGLAPFSVGASVVMLTPEGYRNPGVIPNFFKIIEHFGATSFSGVPTIFGALLRIPPGAHKTSTIQYGICGAAKLPEAIFRAFESHTGIPILEGYGLTEGTCASAVNPRDGERRIGSIGLRLPFQEMKIVRRERGQTVDCMTGEPGLIAIRGPNVFPGYLREEDNQGIWLEDGWLNTGDLGTQDADGYFRITGREKDLIIRGGHNIDPAEVEEILHQHPAVTAAAVVGRIDAYAGEVPVAFVSTRPQIAVTDQDLIHHCKERVSDPAACPKEIFFLETLPVTPIGKIYRPELRRQAAEPFLEEALGPLCSDTEELQVSVEALSQGLSAHLEIRCRPEKRAAVSQRISELMSGFPIIYRVSWRS